MSEVNQEPPPSCSVMTFHRYALCPAPWGWHMKRVPPLRAPLLPRLLREAAFALAAVAASVGVLVLGAALDARDAATIAPQTLAEVVLP